MTVVKKYTLHLFLPSFSLFMSVERRLSIPPAMINAHSANLMRMTAVNVCSSSFMSVAALEPGKPGKCPVLKSQGNPREVMENVETHPSQGKFSE